MKKTIFALTTIYLLWTAIVAVLTGEAATTFTGAIISIGHTQRTITLQTIDGQTWALAVANSSILNQEQVAKGDQVRIEVDLSGRITKITKLAEHPMSDPIQSLEEIRP
jgi:hypothetical protein